MNIWNDERFNIIVKEYNEYLKLIFEDEYLNGLRNNKRKEFNKDGELLFEF